MQRSSVLDSHGQSCSVQRSKSVVTVEANEDSRAACSDPSRAAILCIVVNCSDAGVRGGVGIFFMCAGGVGGQSGEFLVSEG